MLFEQFILPVGRWCLSRFQEVCTLWAFLRTSFLNIEKSAYVIKYSGSNRKACFSPYGLNACFVISLPTVKKRLLSIAWRVKSYLRWPWTWDLFTSLRNWKTNVNLKLLALYLPYLYYKCSFSSNTSLSVTSFPWSSVTIFLSTWPGT